MRPIDEAESARSWATSSKLSEGSAGTAVPVYKDGLAAVCAVAWVWLCGPVGLLLWMSCDAVIERWILGNDHLSYGWFYVGMVIVTAAPFAVVGWLVLAPPFALAWRCVRIEPDWRVSMLHGAVLGSLIFVSFDYVFTPLGREYSLVHLLRHVGPYARDQWIPVWTIGGGAIAGGLMPRLRLLAARRLLSLSLLPIVLGVILIFVTYVVDEF
jgi:hypothetical protein